MLTSNSWTSRKAALAKDVKDELEAALGILSGKGKGAKGKSPRGLERKKMWEEVRALRKEYTIHCTVKPSLTFLSQQVPEAGGRGGRKRPERFTDRGVDLPFFRGKAII